MMLHGGAAADAAGRRASALHERSARMCRNRRRTNHTRRRRHCRNRTAKENPRTPMGTLVNYSTEKGVAVLCLNDPPVNAYTYEMFRELDACILDARFDNDVHVIVITGRGDKYFCAGANINMLREADPTFKYFFCLHANETLSRLEHTPKLCIAALNGHTVGGGLEIALACDLRIQRNGPFKLGLPEVNLGVLPGTGGTQRLARLLGKGKALEMMVEGTNVSPEEAAALGLVNKVWDEDSHDAFMRRVMAYAHELCPPNKAAMAIGRMKRAVQSGLEMSLEQGLALERELQAELFASEDAKEGLVAFTAKRKPHFRAR
jgi:enoyl-CoA hydratase/carnithine racemase